MLLMGVVLGMQSVSAQTSVRNHPGYVDLARLGKLDEVFDREAVIEVNIEGQLLKLVAEASRLDDPELADMLRGLQGIYVRGYEVGDHNFQRVSDRAALVGKELELMGWSAVVKVRDRREHVQMFSRIVDEKVAGMVVMAVENGEEETVFINLVGEIDPEQIGRIGRLYRLGNISNF